MRQKEFMTKQRMFGAPNLRHKKKNTQPLVVMVETFRMSAYTPKLFSLVYIINTRRIIVCSMAHLMNIVKLTSDPHYLLSERNFLSN